ncbi:MAG: hypothetical protein ACYC35_15470 [Pirellulales bacterium]
MKPDLAWLMERRVESVEKKDLSWFFNFEDGSSLGTESAWRLITAEGVAVTSEDHGHSFGLPVPVDAGHVAMAKIAGRPVDRFLLDERTGDLSLCFGATLALQFLTLSSGYEGWRLVHGAQEIISTGGGRVAEPGRWGTEKREGA